MAKSYSEKLKDPKWKEKRKEILDRDNYKCCNCGSSKNLNVHHGFYDFTYPNPWDYPNISLWTLCEDCHHEIHDVIHDVGIEISKINPFDLPKLVNIIRTYRELLGDRAHQKTRNLETFEWE